MGSARGSRAALGAPPKAWLFRLMPLETIPAGRRNPHARARALPIPSPSREKVAEGRMRVNALSQDASACRASVLE